MRGNFQRSKLRYNTIEIRTLLADLKIARLTRSIDYRQEIECVELEKVRRLIRAFECENDRLEHLSIPIISIS